MRPNETVFQYLVAIRELANRGQGFLDETSIIEYCINGIPDSPSNKLILYGCTTIQEFKEKLGIYDKIFQNKSKNHSYDTSRSPDFSSQRRDVESTLHKHRNDRYPKFNAPEPNSKFDWNHVTCFNCSGSGHISKFCPDKHRGPKPNKIKTTDIELSITVTDDKPIYHSPRRLPFTERDIVDKQIDEWIQNGVIEPCSSAYASQVLVVRKKKTAVHEKIEFLGHIIENNKLFPSPSKTKSVVNYPEPKTTKEVQRFLGLTGYFRKFIPAYSVIAKPLSDLLRKDTPFNFDVKQKASFDELKRLLCQKPVLGIYRQNCETEIHTDASIDGLAAVLLQRFPDDNSLHPIYYMSRKTSETERKYTSYELEVLAIIEALKKFKVYILGMPFKIITDCNAFTKTMTRNKRCRRSIIQSAPEDSLTVKKIATSYDGEVLAVCEATAQLLAAGLASAKVAFSIDSQAAVLASGSNTPTDCLNTIQCRAKIAELISYGGTVALQMVPSHVGIPCNKRINQKAKQEV
ncbi:retrovirus-related Pol polyprotein from transposon 297 [Trichonephila clavipes]|nr:retrovirus-related Pol polyprotein from transposon 297 [Trichonephila clavipes]